MKLLDTTLRDGSYVTNFGFSAKQTSDLAAALDDASVPFIEVGHGVGLNASLNGQGLAKETDQDYMRAAADSVKSNAWGMFAIPGICDISHIDSCVDHDIGFLRFGIGVDRVEKVAPFVEKAKNAGIFTAVNFMKSYVISPGEFEKVARQAVDMGADVVYVVDSAGNMTPAKVRSYLEPIQDLETVQIHETAAVDPRAVIGSGTSIWHFSHVMDGAKVGTNCVLGQNVMIAAGASVGEGVKIQNNVSVFRGVTLEDDVFCGPSMVFTNVLTPRAFVDRKSEFASTRVCQGATIGANATIVSGNTIGKYAMVGAGSVVTKNVRSHALVLGSPAREVGWVSRTGEKLGDDLICPRTGEKYRHGDDGLERVE